MQSVSHFKARDTLNHALQEMRDREGWTGVSQRPNSYLVGTGCSKNDADKEFVQKNYSKWNLLVVRMNSLQKNVGSTPA